MFTLIDELTFMIGPQTRPFCGPLFFAHSVDSALGNVVANGSYGLVDTGKTKLLVTCSHVWKEFQHLRHENPDTKMFACLDQNPPVELDPSLYIDDDKECDLATFDIEPLLSACRGRAFYPLKRNPAPKVTQGSPLVFAGYPGMFRFASKQCVQFGRVQYVASVSDVSGVHFVADLSQAVAEYAISTQQPSPATLHGGISGAPCFLLPRNQIPQLIGFVTSECLGLLRFTHARCLNADGTINRQPY